MKKMFGKISYLQLILDLIIVFIGVSLAFLFTNYREQKKEEEETKQVIELLHIGLSKYDKLFSGIISYHERYNIEFKNKLNNQEIPDFTGVIFLSPAYPINAISLLTDQGYKVLNPKVYIALTGFANGIQRLMYVEQKLVDISEKSTAIIRSNFKTSNEYEFEQKKWAEQYLKYLEIRKRILRELQNKNHNLRELLKELY
ncbi:hypothetical protein [Aquimarina sp. 2201CG5-10]|uniref:hypothetical protein n=1 Tax=Aquimarina callyspongiae TaxID=3098150 RepID=UPI002AB48EAC|nr:hypothetical protein [Aquimarina sp. 2201CG5-10]MDY8134539.1 hypothetical protein [Aquimarina sp. 2201CG5-10]